MLHPGKNPRQLPRHGGIERTCVFYPGLATIGSNFGEIGLIQCDWRPVSAQPSRTNLSLRVRNTVTPENECA
jgi:hypothetical protein